MFEQMVLSAVANHEAAVECLAVGAGCYMLVAAGALVHFVFTSRD